MDEMDFNENE
jgi:hypothetical protein